MEELKPCPFCGKPLYIKAKQYSKPILAPLTRAGALRDELIDITGENYVPVEAKYCPVCGRPLGRRSAPENNPLTLEELKQMDEESVWVEGIDKKQHYGKYGGYGQISVWGNGSLEDVSIEAICEAPHGHTCWEEDSYGKTWLAYARKPEGSEP